MKEKVPPPSASSAAATPQQRQDRWPYAPFKPPREPRDDARDAPDALGMRKSHHPPHGRKQAAGPSSSWPDKPERKTFTPRSTVGHQPSRSPLSNQRGRSVQARWEGSTTQHTSASKSHNLQAGPRPGGDREGKHRYGGAQQANTAGTLPRPFLPRVGGIGSTMRPRLLAGDPQTRARLAERAAQGISDERGWEQDNVRYCCS